MHFNSGDQLDLTHFWSQPHVDIWGTAIFGICVVKIKKNLLKNTWNTSASEEAVYCISLLCAMYIIYNIIQQQYRVMLHTQDCTVLELGHSGWVPWLWDITVSTAYIFGFIEITKAWTPTMQTLVHRKYWPKKKEGKKKNSCFLHIWIMFQVNTTTQPWIQSKCFSPRGMCLCIRT